MFVVMYSYIENRSFRETFYSTSSIKVDTPIRIVQLSDLHCSSFGRKNKNLINRIKELDTEDALALSMLGNVEFYAPTGSKKRALEYFQRADSVYNIHAEEYEQWNHHAVKMTIEQCRKKLGK
jgi:predicted MPP superfamily phosphohydrolase